MAKKHTRSGKPTPGGGRVTPKGVRPADTTARRGDQPRGEPEATRPAPTRMDPSHGSRPEGQHAPTRAGHHRGQR